MLRVTKRSLEIALADYPHRAEAFALYADCPPCAGGGKVTWSKYAQGAVLYESMPDVSVWTCRLCNGTGHVEVSE